MLHQLTQLPLPLPKVLEPWLTLNDVSHADLHHFRKHLIQVRLIATYTTNTKLKNVLRKQLDQYVEQWK